MMAALMSSGTSSFGERLRREREMRGITLDEIARSTKIGKRHLEALEREDFDALPGGIFNKGFVRAYARFLGLDEDQAVADYVAADAQQVPALEKFPLDVHVRPDPTMNPRRSFVPVVLALLALAGVLAGWTYWVKHRPKPPGNTGTSEGSRPAPSQSAAPSSQTPGAGAEDAPKSASGQDQVQIQAQTHEGSFTVIVKANEKSWISLKADGKTVAQRELNEGEEQSASAAKEITLIVGNAGGVDVSFNGSPQGRLGEEGAVRIVTFTRQGREIAPVPSTGPQLQ